MHVISPELTGNRRGLGGDMDRPTDIELRLLANKRSELVYMPLLLKTLESSYSCFDRLSIRNK